MTNPRFLSVLLVVAEVWWVASIASAIARRGLPTSPVFWTAAATQVLLGVVTYAIFKKYLSDKRYMRWHFVILALTLVGVGGPIGLYYSGIESLKPAGGTWAVYMLTANSFYVYHVLTRKPLVRSDLPPRRTLLAAKIVYSLSLAAAPVGAIAVALLPLLGFVPPSTLRSPDAAAVYVVVHVVFGVISLLFLAIGFLLPSLAAKVVKGKRSDLYLSIVYVILRSSLFTTVSLNGLVVWLLGGAWYTCLPFFIASGLALFFTFPTRERWARWQAG